jgi:uncharacterized membrane protein
MTRGVVARLVALGIGALIAAYLTLLHYTSAVVLYCPGSGSGLINCTNVLTSPESVWAGIPVPLFGFLWFVAGLLIHAVPRWRRPALKWVWSLVGVVAVLWLLYVELVILRALCLWCSALHLIILGFFVDVVVISPSRNSDHPAE